MGAGIIIGYSMGCCAANCLSEKLDKVLNGWLSFGVTTLLAGTWWLRNIVFFPFVLPFIFALKVHVWEKATYQNYFGELIKIRMCVSGKLVITNPCKTVSFLLFSTLLLFCVVGEYIYQ